MSDSLRTCSCCPRRFALRLALVTLATLFVTTLCVTNGCHTAESSKKADRTRQQEKSNWQSLFDGKSMGDWEIIRFSGNDQVTVEGGIMTLEMGYPFTGVRFNADKMAALPKSNYEIELEAKKIDGTDFFCCLTFPVKDQFCSLVVGGWGGTVSGISCVDGVDASENATQKIRKYNTGQWYRIRVKVTDSKLECWVDEDQIVDLPLQGIKLSLRTDVENCKPIKHVQLFNHCRVPQHPYSTVNQEGK